MAGWRRRGVLATAAVTGLLGVAACGSDSTPEETMTTNRSSTSTPDGPSSSSSPSEPGSSTFPPPTRTTSGPPTEPSEYRPVVVAGTIRSGDGAGCLVLVAEGTGTTYALFGPKAESLHEGERTKLRGRPAPHKRDACRADVPLTVTDLLAT